MITGCYSGLGLTCLSGSRAYGEARALVAPLHGLPGLPCETSLRPQDRSAHLLLSSSSFEISVILKRNMPDPVHTEVYALIDKLAALALPPEHHYYVFKPTGPSYFKLSESQTDLVKHMASDWSESIKIASHLLDDNPGRRVLGWLQEKYETLKAALDGGDGSLF